MSNNNENKLVPRLRFPEFRDDGDWMEKEISEVIEESRIPSNQSSPDKRITVRLNLMGIEKREVRGTEAEGATKFFIRKKGQFIYGKQNLHKGAFGIIPDELDGFESSQDIPAFDFKEGFDSKYFVYYLSQESVHPELEKISTGTGSKRIHPRDFLKILFPFPKLTEQQKIAACLSSLDEVITAEGKKLEALKEHKKGLLQNLFPQEGETVPKLRFPEFENSGEWVEKTLGEIFVSYSGGTPSTNQNSYYGGNIPFIRSAEINKTSTELFLTEMGLKNSSAKMVSKGDLLIALYGANSGDVAISKIDGAINQAILCLKSDYSNLFVYHFLSSKKSWIVSKYIQGGQGNLSGEIVKSIKVLLPLKTEQQKIAACLSSLDEFITAQTQKIELLQQHKKGLLQGLFPTINEQNG